VAVKELKMNIIIILLLFINIFIIKQPLTYHQLVVGVEELKKGFSFVFV